MPERAHVVVVGNGAASESPDQCLLHLTVSGMGATPAVALDVCSKIAERVIAAAIDSGIDRHDVRTVSLSVEDYLDKAQQKVTARIGSYRLEIAVASLTDISQLVSALTYVAGDSLQISSLRLGVKNAGTMKSEARARAVRNAQVKAEELAAAAGIRLGTIPSIWGNEQAELANPVRSSSHSHSPAVQSSVAAEQGDVTVAASVTLTYAIEH